MVNIKKILYFLNYFVFIFANQSSNEDSSFIKSEKEILEYKYDYCDIYQSRLAVLIIEEIRKFINKSNEGAIRIIESNGNINSENIKSKNCMIMKNNLISYVNHFDDIEEINKSSYHNFKCNKCGKKFKSREYLEFHFKLFHLKKKLDSPNPLDALNIQNEEICPVDLCIILNCKRYQNFLNLDKEEKKVFKYRSYECNPSLENFYKKFCMNLIQDCFLNKKDQFNFFNIFCKAERCERNQDFDNDKENSIFDSNKLDDKGFILKNQNNAFSELPKEDSFFYLIYNILLYLISIFSFIYILIVWITKSN